MKGKVFLAGISLMCGLTLMACQQEQQAQEISTSLDQHQAQKEDIVYVVAALSEDGYVLVHGDHQHFEKGSVPYEAKFLKETLLDDSSYRLNESDILYKVRTGYIIRVKGKIYYYPKKAGDGIVSLEEARKLTENNPEHDHHHHDHGHDHELESQSSTSQTGVAGIDRPTTDGFLLTDEKQVESKTATGIVVLHNGHRHFIFYGDLKGSKWEYLIPVGMDFTKQSDFRADSRVSSASHQDHYQFNPADIIAEDANGYTVRHGDHYHYILKQNRGVVANGPVTSTIYPIHTIEVGKPHQPVVPVAPRIQAIAGLDYPTSDGFLFDGKGIIGQNAVGLLVQHKGHTHVLRKEDLARSKWAYLLLTNPQADSEALDNDKSEASDSTSNPITVDDSKGQESLVPSKEDAVITSKRDYLAQALGLPVSSISLLDTPQGQAFMYPHGDHDHLVLLKDIDLTKPFESNEDLERKIDYISKVYGVPKEAIRVSDTTFSFNDPSHAYDPTHVHPYVILRSMLVIPEVTGDPEMDFEAELLAVAKRTGIAPSKLIIRDKKFTFPHGSHDHVLHIQAVDGIEPYLANKLPSIVGSYREGEFARAIVDQEVDRLRQTALEKYDQASKEYRRIERALEEFSSHLDELVTNSTEGYLAMLTQFEKVHILKEETSRHEDQADSLYQSILEKIRMLDTSNLPVNKEELTNQLNQASQDKNRQSLLNLEHILQELKHFQDRPDITAMEYMDYMLIQLDQTYLSPDLRERLAGTLDRLFQATLGGNSTVKPLDLSKELVEVKIALHFANVAHQTYPIQTSPALEKLQVNRAFMEAFVADIREMFTRQMTFPDIVEQVQDEKALEETEPGSEVENQTYQDLLALLRMTNLTGTATSQTVWVERINQASLKRDEKELARISHSLKEIQQFQDRAEIRLMEYMDYLLARIDSPYLKPTTRQEAARLINQIYGMVVRRELAASPISLAEDLIASSIAMTNDIKSQVQQQLEMSEEYGVLQMNRLEMNMFVEGTRDFFVNSLSLPEIVLVEANQPALVQPIEVESAPAEIHPSHAQASSSTEASEVSNATNNQVLASQPEATSEESASTETPTFTENEGETEKPSQPAPSTETTAPSSPIEDHLETTDESSEEDIELSDEDLEWLSDIFGEYTSSVSEEDNEDIGLTWKPLGSLLDSFENESAY